MWMVNKNTLLKFVSIYSILNGQVKISDWKSLIDNNLWN